MQLYCPQCGAPVPAGAVKCPSCPARFGEGSSWKPVPKLSVRERMRQWRQSMVVPEFTEIMKISWRAAWVGVVSGVVFFFGIFFVAASVGGVMGSAPAPAHLYAFMFEIALKVLGNPSEGGLLAVSCFWGAVAAVVTFAISWVRASRRRAQHHAA